MYRTGSRVLLSVILLALIVVLPLAAAQAQGGPAGLTLTDRYVLSEGQQVEGDLVIVAQTITLQHGSRVMGDVAAFAQEVTIRGRITGDVIILAEQVTLGDGAQLDGDVSLCADTVIRDPEARIAGDYTVGCAEMGSLLRNVAPLAFDPSNWTWADFDPATFDWGRLSRIEFSPPYVSPVVRLAGNAGWALFMGAAAALIALAAPHRLRRMSEAALHAPAASGLVGLSALLVMAAVSGAVIISLVLIVTLCLLPLLGLAWLALALMAVMGWAALSLPVGAWFLSLLNVQRVSPVGAAAVGAIMVTFGLGLLGMSVWTLLFYILGGLILTSWGLGAVILTRWGGQAYPLSETARSAAGGDEFPFDV